MEVLEKVDFTKNAVKYIQLYKRGTVWMFDEPLMGIYAEPFVAGASQVIQDMIDSLDFLTNKETPQITFAENMPDFDFKVYLNEDFGNNASYTYYRFDEPNEAGNAFKMDLWLCPCLSMYFNPSPKTICVKFQN